jgi:hypothetical protein
MIHML